MRSDFLSILTRRRPSCPTRSSTSLRRPPRPSDRSAGTRRRPTSRSGGTIDTRRAGSGPSPDGRRPAGRRESSSAHNPKFRSQLFFVQCAPFWDNAVFFFEKGCLLLMLRGVMLVNCLLQCAVCLSSFLSFFDIFNQCSFLIDFSGRFHPIDSH
jgi:hypothetical protein